MKNNLLFVVALALGLTGCDPIEGILKVDKSFNVINEQAQNCTPFGHACPDPKETVNLKPGNYPMKLEMSGKTQAKIYLKTGRRQLTVNLAIPRGRSFPDNGSFLLTSIESGQPFDLQSVVTTTRTDSERRRSFETCQVQYNDIVCGPNGCSTHTGTRTGQRDVEYLVRSIHQKIEASLMDVASKGSLATLDGNRSFADRIYLYQGHCF